MNEKMFDFANMIKCSAQEVVEVGHTVLINLVQRIDANMDDRLDVWGDGDE